MYGTPAPLNLMGGVPEIICHNDNYFYVWLKVLQTIQEEVWTSLAAAYAPSTSEAVHTFQVGDLVYVR